MGEALDRVRVIVLARPDLQGRLLAHRDPAGFTAALRELAIELGAPLADGEVDEAITAARREWFERWI